MSFSINSNFQSEFIKATFAFVRRGHIDRFRLAWRVLWSPGKHSGRFRFSFGEIQYTDVESLYYQFRELFDGRCYDFATSNPQPVLFDCGGNIGMSVIRFKMLYPAAVITVFEPDPSLAVLLAQNLAECSISNVKILNAAAATFKGTANFICDGVDSGHLAENGESRVETVRLAECLPENVDLLKLDIEGGEFSIIDDLVGTGAIHRVQRVVMEVHASSTRPEEVSKIVGQLTSVGFAITVGFARTVGKYAVRQESTPFQCLADGAYLLHLYAWRPEQTELAITK